MSKKLIIMAFLFLLAWRVAARAQQVTPAELPGFCLKWVHIAEPLFEGQHLNLNKYKISVAEIGDDEVIVEATQWGLKYDPHVRGNLGKIPAYSVTIRKSDGHVMHAEYIR